MAEVDKFGTTDEVSDGHAKQNAGPMRSAMRGVERRFGEMTASEAARKRWERERERQTASTDDLILEALERKAMDGDVGAAREVREWRKTAREHGESPLDVLMLLTREQRSQVREWVNEARGRG